MSLKEFSIVQRIRSFKFAFNGLWIAIKNEHNFWIHMFAAIAVVFVGVILKLNIKEWTIITFAIGLVFVSELFNTAIERLCDYITTEKNSVIKQVKDISAAAVLVSALTSAIIGLIIFIPKITALFQ